MKSSGKKTAARQVSLRLPIFLFLFFSALITPALAQQTTLRSQSNVVLVPALVKDSAGQTVYGLESKDFVIEDDGAPQLLRLDETPEGQPISLVLAVETGRRAYHEFPRLAGLRTMLDPLFAQGTARVAVVEFDSSIHLTRNFSKDESLIDADLSNLQRGDDGAKILDAIQYSINLLKQESEDRLRVLLLISEVHDHGSKVKVEDAVSAIGQSNSVMYALTFSPGVSNILDTARGNNIEEMHQGIDFLSLAYQTAQALRKNIPATVAAMTGGEYDLFTNRKKFDARMNDFTNHLHSRYLLSFAPKEPRPGLHQIRVKVKNPQDRTVLARTSYWVEGTK